MRTIYKWSGGALNEAGSLPEAHLRAWEYEVASDQTWAVGTDDTIRLWRTRRPDVAAPVELWVGDREIDTAADRTS